MLTDRKNALRREIAAKEKELAKLDALPDLTDLVDGAVVALFVTHGRSKPYTYIAYLTVGRFYLTGNTSPNGVDADGLADWLTTSGRRLVGALVIGNVTTEQIPAFDLAGALLDSMTEFAGVRRGWNPFIDSPYGD